MPPRDGQFGPRFAHPADYCGVWAIEPRAFTAQVERVRAAQPAAMTGRWPIAAQGERVAAKGGKSIAIVRVMGTLMKEMSFFGGASSVALRREIRAAARDADVAAILLAIDSPGGTVAGTADLAAEVRAAAKAKPVWAFADDLAASAAYWVASQAERVYANDATALVGSIGTLLIVDDWSGLFEKEGVKVHVVSTGPLKGAGVIGAAVSDEQLKYFQGIVDATQESFDQAVMRGRKLTARQLESVRTGAVFPAAEAQRRKLIDGVQSMDQTLQALTAAATGRRAVRAWIGGKRFAGA